MLDSDNLWWRINNDRMFIVLTFANINMIDNIFVYIWFKNSQKYDMFIGIRLKVSKWKLMQFGVACMKENMGFSC